MKRARRTTDKVIAFKEPAGIDTELLATKLGISKSKLAQMAIQRLWVDEMLDFPDCA